MTEVLDGNAIGDRIREELRDPIGTLADAGHRLGLATVLMSDDPSSETYVRTSVAWSLATSGSSPARDPATP